MLELAMNPAPRISRAPHPDPDVAVFLVDDFLAEPQRLLDYARERAYFGGVGEDGTAYPGIRDRLPRPYDRVLLSAIERVYGSLSADINRCLLSLTTLQPSELSAAQKLPHIDAFGEDQYAGVHYLCGPPHGGTGFYRYLPRDLARIREADREVVNEMRGQVRQSQDEHAGYISGDTSLFRQELLIDAQFNRLILYPSNLLHCAQLSARESLVADSDSGRLTVASFFRLHVGPQAVDVER